MPQLRFSAGSPGVIPHDALSSTVGEVKVTFSPRRAYLRGSPFLLSFFLRRPFAKLNPLRAIFIAKRTSASAQRVRVAEKEKVTTRRERVKVLIARRQSARVYVPARRRRRNFCPIFVCFFLPPSAKKKRGRTFFRAKPKGSSRRGEKENRPGRGKPFLFSFCPGIMSLWLDRDVRTLFG